MPVHTILPCTISAMWPSILALGMVNNHRDEAERFKAECAKTSRLEHHVRYADRHRPLSIWTQWTLPSMLRPYRMVTMLHVGTEGTGRAQDRYVRLALKSGCADTR